MSAKLLVTGATGNVGAEVVNLLQKSSHLVRATGTDVAAITRKFGTEIEAVKLDFYNPETFGPAFAGIERLFLMRPPAISDVKRTIAPLVEAAKRAGVRHIVFLSLIGVEKNWIVPHYKIEQSILASGLDYTFLRASFFMQNLSATHLQEIKERNELFIPAGKGKTSFIDVRDIAAVATLALTQDGHAKQAYELTGNQALDYYQVADLFSKTLGRKITYQEPSLLQFIGRQRAQGVAFPFIAVMAGIYTTARLGWAARITTDTQRLLGRAPIVFRQYIEDYKEVWSSD